MARNPVAKLILGFFFILDVLFIITFFFDFVKKLAVFILSFAFLRPLSPIFFIETIIVAVLFIVAVKVAKWLWREIEE